jgi:hypothetical protein
LNFKSINLNNHLITRYKTEKKVALLLGSSAAAGSNIYHKSTLADYLNNNSSKYFFFNLASLEGTLLDSMVFLDQAVQIKKPDLIILGLGPSMFDSNFGSLVPDANIEILKKFLPNESIVQLQLEKKRKLYFPLAISLITTKTIPYPLILETKAFFNKLSIKLFGHSFNSSVQRQPYQRIKELSNSDWLLNLEAIARYCKKKQLPLVVYLEPYLFANNFYAKNDWSIYEGSLQDYFNKNQIPAMNFIREIPNEAEYFIDYQHLTPKGYEFLATDISIKLNGMNL